MSSYQYILLILPQNKWYANPKIIINHHQNIFPLLYSVFCMNILIFLRSALYVNVKYLFATVLAQKHSALGKLSQLPKILFLWAIKRQQVEFWRPFWKTPSTESSPYFPEIGPKNYCSAPPENIKNKHLQTFFTSLVSRESSLWPYYLLD